MRIILVDDMEIDQELTIQLLKKAYGSALTVERFYEPENSVDTLIKGNYDVGLVDYSMGNISGDQLIKQVIQGGCTRPLIMLTSMKDARVDQAALNAGAMDFLNKQNLAQESLERSIRYSIRQKTVENQLKDSLADRQRLLDEIQRRLNQNLGALSNVLKVNTNAGVENNSLKALDAARSRILSLGTVQTLIYGKGQPDALEAQSFLRSISDNTLHQSPDLLDQVDLQRAISPKLTIPFSISVTLGIMVGEIISSALRRFRQNPTVQAEITLKAGADNTLVMEDNLPWSNQEEGQHSRALLELLAMQMGGELGHNFSSVNTWTITWDPIKARELTEL